MPKKPKKKQIPQAVSLPKLFIGPLERAKWALEVIDVQPSEMKKLMRESRHPAFASGADKAPSNNPPIRETIGILVKGKRPSDR